MLISCLPEMKVNRTASFKIYIGDLTTAISNLTATSSDTSVVEVSIDGDQLIVSTKAKGNATITLSIDASRANMAEQNYSYDYSITVVEETSLSWTGIIIGAIGLLLAVVLVYSIMVKRRLIAGKYPKY